MHQKYAFGCWLAIAFYNIAPTIFWVNLSVVFLLISQPFFCSLFCNLGHFDGCLQVTYLECLLEQRGWQILFGVRILLWGWIHLVCVCASFVFAFISSTLIHLKNTKMIILSQNRSVEGLSENMYFRVEFWLYLYSWVALLFILVEIGYWSDFRARIVVTANINLFAIFTKITLQCQISTAGARQRFQVLISGGF